MRCRALLAGRAGLRLFAAPVKQAWMRGLLGLLGPLALLLTSAVGIDNGIGMVPPQGWRSWNSFPCEQSSATQLRGGDIIDDAAMRAQMAAVKDRSRKLFNGSTISLADIGFNYISMDDGWQQCNCSTHQDIDPILAACPAGAAMSFRDPQSGAPLVNKHRFPDMKAMVDFGHSLGLKVGTYLNNCICE